MYRDQYTPVLVYMLPALHNLSPPDFLRQGFTLNLELLDLARLAGQQALGILLFLPPLGTGKGWNQGLF